MNEFRGTLRRTSDSHSESSSSRPAQRRSADAATRRHAVIAGHDDQARCCAFAARLHRPRIARPHPARLHQL